ncbi:MAG TPA: sigma-E processing peptidase SpoIIGA [Limnochordales bacterium]
MAGLAYLVANLVFDYALLWATGRLHGRPAVPSRLALGAWIGAATFTLLPPVASPALLVLSCLAVSWLMIAAAYRVPGLRALGTLVATLWAVGCVAAGAGVAAQSLLEGAAPRAIGPVVSLVALAAVATVVRPRLAAAALARALRVRVVLRFERQRLEVVGLVDTGNRLREPVEGLPVILLDPDALAPLLEPALRDRLGRLAAEPLSLAMRLPALAPQWARRFRLVPFRAVGTERGVMAAFRADSLVLHGAGGPPLRLGPAVVALSPTPLEQDEAQALIPAEYVTAPSSSPHGDVPEATGRKREGGVVGVETG